MSPLIYVNFRGIRKLGIKISFKVGLVPIIVYLVWREREFAFNFPFHFPLTISWWDLWTKQSQMDGTFVQQLQKDCQPRDNFINVKSTNFLYERRVSAAFSSCMYVEKQRSYEKFVHLMLMKLTPKVLKC